MLTMVKRGKVYYAIGSVRGKRIRKSLNTSQKHVAKIHLEDLQQDILSGKDKIIDKNFNDAVESYLRRNPQTSDTTTQYLIRFGKQFDGCILEEFTTESVENWLDDRLDDGVAPATVRREMNAFMPVLRHANARGWMKELPNVTRPADGEPRLRFLNEQEFEAMFLTPQCKAKGGAHEMAWHLAHILVNTGARLGEIVQLVWGDVVLKSNDPYVRLSTKKRKGGKKSLRQVPLNGIVVDTFNSLLEGYSVPPQDTAQVFPMWNDQRSAGKQVKIVAECVGVTDFRPHDLRRTFATRLLNNGVNPRTVADLLGHTDLTMVMRYMVPPDELKRSAVDALVMAQKPMFS